MPVVKLDYTPRTTITRNTGQYSRPNPIALLPNTGRYARTTNNRDALSDGVVDSSNVLRTMYTALGIQMSNAEKDFDAIAYLQALPEVSEVDRRELLRTGRRGPDMFGVNLLVTETKAPADTSTFSPPPWVAREVLKRDLETQNAAKIDMSKSIGRKIIRE